MESSPIISWEIDGGNNENSGRLYFLGLQNHCRWWRQPWNQKTLAPWKKSYDQPWEYMKEFSNKGQSSQNYGFSSSHVWMWELDYKESWEPRNWCYWTVVLEKTLESPLDWKEVKPVHPNGNQSWVFIGRTDAEAETPILWPHNNETLIHLKRPWCWERLKAGGEGDNRGWEGWWHHRFDGDEFEQAPGVRDGQGSRFDGGEFEQAPGVRDGQGSRFDGDECEQAPGVRDGQGSRFDGDEFEQAPGVRDGQGSLECRSPWGPKLPTGLSDWTVLLYIVPLGGALTTLLKRSSSFESASFFPIAGSFLQARKAVTPQKGSRENCEVAILIILLPLFRLECKGLPEARNSPSPRPGGGLLTAAPYLTWGSKDSAQSGCAASQQPAR